MPKGFPKDVSKFVLIVSDVDGTLMGGKREVSEAVCRAVRRWQDSGKMFTIASGRSYYMLKDELNNLQITTPVVVRGGSEIVDPNTNKILYAKNISAQTVADFINFLKRSQYDVMVEKEDKYYSTYPYDVGRYPHIKRLSLDEFAKEEAPKINVPLGNKSIEEFERFANTLVDTFPQLHIVRSYNDLGKSLDVTSKRATKNLAVLELIRMLGVEREHTVGVGDGYNDFPLMQATGFKVAMGNAREELKAIADVVVPGLHEDGVAYLIDQLLK